MLLVTDKVLQNQEMAARPNVTLLMKAFALERREMLGIMGRVVLLKNSADSTQELVASFS